MVSPILGTGLAEVTTKPPVGWIGVGKMGGPMSRHVLQGGYALSIVEPNPENRSAAIRAGATASSSLADLAARSEVVVLTIPDDEALRALAFGEEGILRHLRRGQTVIEMSTVSPKISAELATELAARNVSYLRAPVSGSTATATAAKLTVLVSGPRDSFDACEPLLACFSSRRFHVGHDEEARYLKLVINSLVGATSALVAEALSLGSAGGLSVKDMLEVICESAVASPLIGYKRDMMVTSNYDPAFSVRQMLKDFDLILEAAEDERVPMKLVALVREQYEDAISAGQAERDFFILVQQHAKAVAASRDQGTNG